MKDSILHSIFIHAALLLVVGCAVHKPATVTELSPEVMSARDYVAAVAAKLPLWDADSTARFETVEIATVKADIAMATDANTEQQFLADVDKLEKDFNDLMVLDELLKQNYYI